MRDTYKTFDCPKCDGEGKYDAPHPLWGTRSCPEAYTETQCTYCEGTGQVEQEDRDDWLEAKL